MSKRVPSNSTHEPQPTGSASLRGKSHSTPSTSALHAHLRTTNQAGPAQSVSVVASVIPLGEMEPHSPGAVLLPSLPSPSKALYGHAASGSARQQQQAAGQAKQLGSLTCLFVAFLWGSSQPSVKFLLELPTPPSAALLTTVQSVVSCCLFLAVWIFSGLMTLVDAKAAAVATAAAATRVLTRPARQFASAFLRRRNKSGTSANTHCVEAAMPSVSSMLPKPPSELQLHSIEHADGEVCVGVSHPYKDHLLQHQHAPNAPLRKGSLVSMGSLQRRVATWLRRPCTSLGSAAMELGMYTLVAMALATYGVQRISATKAAFLGQATSLVTPVLVALSGQHVPLPVWSACCCGVMGGMLVATDSAASTSASVSTSAAPHIPAYAAADMSSSSSNSGSDDDAMDGSSWGSHAHERWGGLRKLQRVVSDLAATRTRAAAGAAATATDTRTSIADDDDVIAAANAAADSGGATASGRGEQEVLPDDGVLAEAAVEVLGEAAAMSAGLKSAAEAVAEAAAAAAAEVADAAGESNTALAQALLDPSIALIHDRDHDQDHDRYYKHEREHEYNSVHRYHGDSHAHGHVPEDLYDAAEGDPAADAAPTTATAATAVVVDAVPGSLSSTLGLSFVLGSCVFYSLATVRMGVHSLRFDAMQLSCAATVVYTGLALVWLLSERLLSPPMPEPLAGPLPRGFSHVSHLHVQLQALWSDRTALAVCLWTGFGPGALSSYLQAVGQRLVPAAQAQVIYSSAPVFSTILAQMMLPGERLGAMAWMGGAIMLCSSLCSSLFS